jgi:hypothetical protein
VRHAIGDARRVANLVEACVPNDVDSKQITMRTSAFFWRATVNIVPGLRSYGLAALALGIQLWVAPCSCRAGFVPVIFQAGSPTVTGSNGGLSYKVSTGDFNVAVTAPTLTLNGAFINPSTTHFAIITSPRLVIDVLVDTNGNFVGNGTGVLLLGSVTFSLSDGGSVTFSGTSTANPLLSGSITAFGAPAAGPPSLTFDGLFTLTGGALTTTKTDSKGNPVFGGFPLGGPGGFLLDAENVTGGTLGDFTHDFSSSSVKPTVGVVVPAPATLTLLLAGAAVLAPWSLTRTWRRVLAPLGRTACTGPDCYRSGATGRATLVHATRRA